MKTTLTHCLLHSPPYDHEIASTNMSSKMGSKALTPGMVIELFTDEYERRTRNQNNQSNTQEEAFSADTNKKTSNAPIARSVAMSRPIVGREGEERKGKGPHAEVKAKPLIVPYQPQLLLTSRPGQPWSNGPTMNGPKLDAPRISGHLTTRIG